MPKSRADGPSLVDSAFSAISGADAQICSANYLSLKSPLTAAAEEQTIVPVRLTF